MRKKKNNVYVGLDGLDIKVNTTKVLEQNYYIFYNNNNDETGHLQAVKDGYLLHLCLPKLLRTDNKIPFGKEDFKHIENVLECVQTQLESLFEDDIYETMVRTCEVNATAELSDVTKTAPMLKLLATILLTKGEKLFICATGEQTGKRYEAVNARIKPEIEKLNSEVGALYIKGFNLRQVQQKYTAELKQMKGGTVFE